MAAAAVAAAPTRLEEAIRNPLANALPYYFSER
jgi:hypothetical protein